MPEEQDQEEERAEHAADEVRPGSPLTPGDAAFMTRFDEIMRVPIIVAAVLPLLVAPQDGGWLGVVVGIGTWLVFLVDFVVRVRHLDRYGHTGLGRFDFIVVVLTAPWFLLPGAGAGRFVIVLRLARLGRLAIASRGARELLARLGRVVVIAGAVLTVGAFVAYYAEHPTNPSFATIGDSFWWALVTLTTVGYGDIVPHTATGRWAGVAIMITGIAVLGLLAGSLASFFRLDPGGADDEGEPGHATDERLAELTAEVAEMRHQLGLLVERLDER